MTLSAAINRVRNHFRRRASTLLGCRWVEIRPKSPIVSITFDDFPASALEAGGEILEQHGAVGTYYTALGLEEQMIPAGRAFSRSHLFQAIERGHELGCHTFDHFHSWTTPPKTFERSIRANAAALDALLPGYRLRSLSYPISCPRPKTKRLAAHHFSCCRGGGESFNHGRVDASNLSALFLEKLRDVPAKLERLIEENAKTSGWLILATHDVCGTPSEFGCTPHFLDQTVRTISKSGARILPVAKAWAEIFPST